ncbi:MAG: response regulator [Gammaproteobacteria bacterium]|nr:response regulator [Gammaproteobacteria bacterium]
MKVRKEKISRRILVPLGLVLLFLLAVSVFSIHQLQQRHLVQNVETYLKETKRLFQMKLEEEAKILESEIKFITRDKNLQKAWLAKDRDALLHHATPLFCSLGAKYRVTHFYFIDTDKVCFLRVHNADRHGDLISRFTLEDAMWENRFRAGIELGVFGTFTLRAVVPWQIDGKTVGYVELGKEIRHITAALKKILEIEFFIAIDKSKLDRAEWERGLKMMGRTGDWEELPRMVVIDRSMPVFPRELADYLNSASPFEHEHQRPILKISVDGRQYRGGFVHQPDAGNHEVGHLIVLNDVTEEETMLRITLAVLISVSFITGGALFALFYFHIIRIEKYLQKSQQKLTAQQEAAEAANRAKTEFLANMSHEIRTPLNGILGFAQILDQDESLSAQQRDAVGAIRQSGGHLLVLLNDILDLSKVEAGGMELNPDEFHLRDFLEAVADIIRVRAQEKGIAFKCEFGADPDLVVKADETRLRQVLINLLGNAVKFTEQGEVIFSVCSHGAETRFQIADTGSGIAADELQLIFEPFRQASVQKHKNKGTGLGLAISKRLVLMMGSALNVESAPGAGSTFRFDLSLPSGIGGKLLPDGKKSARLISGFRGKSRRVLVVDDDCTNREVLVNMLLPLGFELFEAADGLEGVEKARTIKPDAIFMDLVMPVTDGYEATRRIRTELADTVIIAASASAFEQYQQKSQAAGCDDFIAKPINAEQLLDKLKQHLGLEWVYKAGSEVQNPNLHSPLSQEGTENASPAALIAPPANILEILYDLSMRGNLPRIHDQAAGLPEIDIKYTFFANELQRLADEFETRKLHELITRFRKQDPGG